MQRVNSFSEEGEFDIEGDLGMEAGEDEMSEEEDSDIDYNKQIEQDKNLEDGESESSDDAIVSKTIKQKNTQRKSTIEELQAEFDNKRKRQKTEDGGLGVGAIKEVGRNEEI